MIFRSIKITFYFAPTKYYIVAFVEIVLSIETVFCSLEITFPTFRSLEMFHVFLSPRINISFPGNNILFLRNICSLEATYHSLEIMFRSL